MSEILDKIIILFCCFLFLSEAPSSIMGVLCILFAITVSSLNTFFTSKKTVSLCTALYFLLILFRPEFGIMLPLLYYDILRRHLKEMACLGLLPFFFTISNLSALPAFILIFFLCLSLWIAYKSMQNESMADKIIRIRDYAEERTILLKNKNKALTEQQNAEIRLATLSERNRIAREIHDNVGHMLSRSILQLGALLATNRDAPNEKGLLALKDTLNQAMTSIRQSVHDLHDESIDLEHNIRTSIACLDTRKLTFDYDVSEQIPKEIKYCFIAIIKEASHNIVKHSNATAVTIILREHPVFYQLLIEDNGTAISTSLGNGIGLENMEERVSSLNGTFRLNTTNGFRIFIMIPKP